MKLRSGMVGACILLLAVGVCVLVPAGATVQLKDPATATSFADELYEIISPDLYIIRLFHRNGWTGSHTIEKLKNESQALYPIATEGDLADFVSTNFDAPKAVFVNRSLLSRSTLFSTLKATGSVSAVFLQFVNETSCVDTTNCPSYDVSDSPPSPLGYNTPSGSLNPDPNHIWVPSGNAAVLDNFSFPIFELPDEESSNFAYAKALENVFVADDEGISQAEWPFIAAEPHLYLGPDEMTSTKCLQMSTVRADRHYCDPLGGQSVWSAAQDPDGLATAVTRDDNIVLVTASLDVRNLIQTQPGVGADQTVSALVALLTAADAISKISRDGWESSTRVVFAAFEGERFGFLGSRRFINDLFTPATAPNVKGFGGFSCDVESSFNNATYAKWCVQPFRYSLAFQDVDPQKVTNVIAIDGVGTGNSTDIFLHSPTADTSFADKVRTNTQSASALNSVNVQLASNSASVPPTPLSSAIAAELPSLSGVTIAGYDSVFSNVNYMGPGDTLETLDSSKIVAAAVTTVEAVLAAVGVDSGAAVSGASVNASLVEELLICFLQGPEDDGCTLYANYAYIYPSYDKSTLYSAAPTSWIGSPSTPYGTYSLYTGTFQQPYLYREGEGWDSSYTQVNWLHRVGDEFVPFDDAYEYNPDTDSLTVPTLWQEYFVWNYLADVFGTTLEVDSGDGSASSTCDSYTDCGDEPNVACINGQCKKHFTYFHDAVSTAVSALDYQVYEVLTDSMYDSLPIYTEPVWGLGWWDTPQIRLFVPVNPIDEWILFGVGVAVLLVSTLFTYFKLPQILTRSRVILE